MKVSHGTTCLGMLVVFAAGLAAAAAPTQSGTVLLRLMEGVSQANPGDRHTRDMELEMTLRDGRFEKRVHGFAVDFCKADHDGEIVAVEGDSLSVELTLNPDKWGPPAPGAAKYRIELKRNGDEFTGAYSGALSWPGREGTEKNA